MQTTIKDITIELADDTILIRDAKSLELLRAKVFKPHEAVEKYHELVKIYREKNQK
jgi:hypothetical protein